jgi:hypothetical protein
MTLVVCIIPLFTGEVIHVDVHTGEIPDGVTPFENKCCALTFTALKYVILLGLYGGALCVVYGIMTYEPPAGMWPAGKEFPVAPAVQCTISLACQYFIVYGGIQVARSWTQFTGMKMTKFENAMMVATASINFAPMLAIVHWRSYACSSDGPSEWQPSALGAKLLLHVHVCPARANNLFGCRTPRLAGRGQAWKG